MKEILLKGKYGGKAKVDDRDFARLNRFCWYATKLQGRPYPALTLQKRDKRTGKLKKVFLHRLLKPCPGVTDHENGDTLDARRSNLRCATHAENIANSKLSTANRSGFKGVSWYRGKWRAVLVKGGRQKSLKYHSTVENAARAYDAAARLHFGEFARLNFPEVGERGLDGQVKG